MPHPIENIMQTSVSKLKEIVDVSTVVGSPVMAGENGVILPISKVSMGFISGGAEYSAESEGPVKRSSDMMEKIPMDYPFAGASAAGMNLTPMGFLYVNGDTVRLLSTNYASPVERMIDAVPQILQMVKEYAEENPKDSASV